MGGVSYTDCKKEILEAVSACILLRKNFQNGVVACSVTKIPLGIPNKPSEKCCVTNFYRDLELDDFFGTRG
jgi:hypothetical protein